MAGGKKYQGRNKAMPHKLDAKKVRDIRELYARSEATQGQLARDYGVSVITIGRVIRHESWQDIPDRDPPPSEAATPEEILNRVVALQRSLNPQGVADELLDELDKGSEV